MDGSRPFTIQTLVLITLLLTFVPSALGNLYLETGLGAGKVLAGAPSLFGSTAPSGLSTGVGTNLTLGYVMIGRADSLMQTHIGLQHRLTTGSHRPDEYAMMTAYPLLRFEFPRMYFGGGFTPFVWARHAKSFGLDGFNSSKSSYGLLGEAALLWRVVPFFHIALGASIETIHTPKGFGPNPAAQGTLQLRFFLNDKGVTGSGRRRYDGWRYPFGIELF